VQVLDDKKRLFGLINPVDLAVIVALLVVALIAVRVLFGAEAPTVKREEKALEMTIVAGGVPEVQASQFDAGETLRKKNGRPIGTITSVSIRPAETEVPTAEGGLARAQSPVFSEVVFEVEAVGELTEEGVMIDGSRVRQNMVVDIATSTFEANDARVVSLTFTE
jgi:hypothetical protein